MNNETGARLCTRCPLPADYAMIGRNATMAMIGRGAT